MSMLERRRVFKVCGQGTSARRSSRYARAAHRQRADMEPCILGRAMAAGVVVMTVLTLRSRCLTYVSAGGCSRQVFQRLAS
jgi:hypothetical protein